MKTLALIAVLPFAASAATWEIDSSHAAAKFSVRHMMLTDVTGTLGKVSGTVDYDDKEPQKAKVDLTIDIDPNTQEPKRDAHLKSADFFDAEKFPQARFKSKKVEKNGDQLKVTGDLTLKGVSKEVTLDVNVLPEVVNPFSKQPARAGTATGTINRAEWGLKWNMPMANNGLVVGNEVKIEVAAELKKPAPAAARN
jgi:polyisoprenoid-binding protein YceI